VIENFSFHPHRRCDVAVGTSYDADIDQTRAVLREAINAMEHKLDDPESVVMLLGFGASSIDWSVRVWVPTSEFWPTRDALTREIKYRLDEADIVIPYPQMDVYFPKGMRGSAG
jgi:small conductance mechanosensitive channel